MYVVNEKFLSIFCQIISKNLKSKDFVYVLLLLSFFLLILQNETSHDSEICYLVRLLESQDKTCFKHVSYANTTI